MLVDRKRNEHAGAPCAARRALRYVLITERAAATMDAVARREFESRGTEWGGVTFGRVWEHDGHPVAVVEDAAQGICSNATAVGCEILPESWPYGEAQLRNANRRVGVRIGTWHSHPHMDVIPSQRLDVPAFWSYSHVDHFVGIIVNPFGDPAPKRSCWVIVGDSLQRAISYLIPAAIEKRYLLAETGSCVVPATSTPAKGGLDVQTHARCTCR